MERLPAPDAPPKFGARPRRLLRRRQKLTGVRGDVHVGAAHDETDALTLERLTKRVHQRGQCRSARRLNDELCRSEQEPHRGAQVIVGHQHHIVHECAIQRVLVGLAAGCAKGVGDCSHGVDGLRRSGIEAATHAVRTDGFDDVHTSIGAHLLHGAGHAAT